MSFRRGILRLLIVAVVIWELFWLLLLSMNHGGSGTNIAVGMMIGGPLVAYALVRGFFWIIEGFKGSPLQ